MFTIVDCMAASSKVYIMHLQIGHLPPGSTMLKFTNAQSQTHSAFFPLDLCTLISYIASLESCVCSAELN